MNVVYQALLIATFFAKRSDWSRVKDVWHEGGLNQGHCTAEQQKYNESFISTLLHLTWVLFDEKQPKIWANRKTRQPLCWKYCSTSEVCDSSFGLRAKAYISSNKDVMCESLHAINNTVSCRYDLSKNRFIIQAEFFLKFNGLQSATSAVSVSCSLVHA